MMVVREEETRAEMGNGEEAVRRRGGAAVAEVKKAGVEDWRTVTAR